MVLTTYGRSSGFCIDPVEKSRSTTFIRDQHPVLRHRGLQPGVQVLPELDISKSREMDRLQDQASRKRSPTRRSSWAANRSRSRTTTR